MSQEIGWSVEAKLLYQIKQLTRALNSRTYISVFPNFASFPNPGITGTLYVDESTGDIYVWNGTSYVLLSSGITALNGLIAAAQTFATGTTGTDFNISSVGTTHTFNFPTASATNRGLLSSADWTTFNNKQNALTNPITGTGTTNYVPKFTGSGTIGNSIIQDDGTNVGVGGAPVSPIKFRILQTSDVTNGGLGIYSTDGAAAVISRMTDGGLVFRNGGAERMRLTAAGNLGIGTTTPAEISGYIGTTTNGSTGSWHILAAGGTNRAVFETGGPFSQLKTITNEALSFGTNNTERMRLTAAGALGVGVIPSAWQTVTGVQLGTGGSFTSHRFAAGNNQTYVTSNLYYDNAGFKAIYTDQVGMLRIVGREFRFETGGTTTADNVASLTQAMTLTSAGRLLVGTTTEGTNTVDIAGTLRSTQGANFATSSGDVRLTSGGGNVGVGVGLLAAISDKIHLQNGNLRYGFDVNFLNIYGKIGHNGNSGGLEIYNQYDVAGNENSGVIRFINGINASTSEKMRISHAGNVGIGTTTPQQRFVVSNAGSEGVEFVPGASSNLNIIQSYNRGTSAWSDLAMRGATHNIQIATNSALYIDASSRVGIGTTSPSVKLDVSGSMRVNSGSTNPMAVFTGDEYNQVQVTDGSRTMFMQVFNNGGNFGMSSNSNLSIYTNNAERLRITNAGNVGIGTTSPLTATGYVAQTIRAGATGSLLQLTDGTVDYRMQLVNSNLGGSFGTYSNHQMDYVTNNVVRMRIASTGNVLIGTTTDDGNRFQVAGTMINSTSAYFATSSGNVGIRQTIFGTSAVGTLAIGNGTAPTTSPADAIQMYSADVVAGNAAPHFRTENGAVVKVYQETTGVGAATFVQGSVNAVYEDSTFDGYTLKQIVKALRNQGLLA